MEAASTRPYIAVIGNNSAMNQIRYGQPTKYAANCCRTSR